MLELLAGYLAGLSFFFTGVAGISENLRRMSGQQFRKALAKSTHHPVEAGLLGVVLGALTQSTSVVAFILSGMTASGLLPMERALMVLSCASVGTALLVFIATLDLHLPILFLIGICGLLLAFQLFQKLRPMFSVLLSVGLVFFGLDLMKQVFKPLSHSQGFAQVGKFLDYWPDMAFFAGMIMRTFLHSSSAIAAIAVTVGKSGALDEFPSMLSMAGLGVGTAIATYLLSSNLKGIPKQIALYQAVTNSAAGVLMGVLLVFEHMTRWPLLMALDDRFTPSLAGRTAYMYFAFNVTIVFVSLVTLKWAPAWLERMCPPTKEQDLSRPQFIQTEALQSPDTALDLVALEQLRLLRSLTGFLEIARGSETEVELAGLHEGAGTLTGEITQFLEALVSESLSATLTARVISFQRKQETLRALEDNVYLFAHTLEARTGDDKLAGRLVESLDTILLTAVDALASRDAMDVGMLTQMTDDRGSMMERLRKQIKVEDGDATSVAAVHYATTLFERNVWLLRQLALWVKEDVGAG